MPLADAESTTLRFAVGTRVLCNCGVWKAGTVIRHFYTQKSFPPATCTPYQIKLDEGKKVFAPKDRDSVIQRLDNGILGQPAGLPRGLKATHALPARSCALAMALHPRLGAASPARHCPPEVLRKIMGFTDLLERRRLAMIRVRAGKYVDRLELHFSDGSTSVCGGSGGTWHEPFTLAPGESLRRIHVRQGDALDSIQFCTTRGRSSPRYGGGGGNVRLELGLPDELHMEIADLGISRTVRGWLAPLEMNFDVVHARRPSTDDEAALDTILSHEFAKIHARAASQPTSKCGAVWVAPSNSDDDDDDSDIYGDEIEEEDLYEEDYDEGYSSISPDYDDVDYDDGYY